MKGDTKKRKADGTEQFRVAGAVDLGGDPIVDRDWDRVLDLDATPTAEGFGRGADVNPTDGGGCDRV